MPGHRLLVCITVIVFCTYLSICLCLCLQNAYEVAKNVLLEESGKCVYMNLIKLQPSGEEFNDKMLKACMRIVDHIATDEVAKDAVQRITEVNMYVTSCYFD